MTREHYARIADLYDMFVQTETDVPFFLERARNVPGDVLELMAGRLSIPLAKADQRQALERIYSHLAPGGRFICTLHNPEVRIKAADGQLRLAGRFTAGPNQLFVWLHQTHRPETNLIEVLEFFEEYDAGGQLVSKRFSELAFHLLERAAFEELFMAAGFEAVELFGDYAGAPFDAATSPFMIWVLRRAAA